MNEKKIIRIFNIIEDNKKVIISKTGFKKCPVCEEYKLNGFFENGIYEYNYYCVNCETTFIEKKT